MSCVSLEEAPRNVLSDPDPTGSVSNAGSNSELPLPVKTPLLNAKLDQSSVLDPKEISDQVADAPDGFTVGQPLTSVWFVPAVTGVAIAGPPLANGRKQILPVRWASPSIWNTPFAVELSTPD